MFNTLATGLFGILLAICGITVLSEPFKAVGLIIFFGLCLTIKDVFSSKAGVNSGN